MPYLKETIPKWLQGPVRRLKHRLIWQYRQRTWQHRALPDFMIIGAMKSGTSSLFAYLKQHPQLYPSCKKEVKFFNGGEDTFEKGQEWYRAHFPLRDKMSADFQTFEASAGYMNSPLAPKRIFDLIPNVKIIAVLRNPTERAISHYFHERRHNREPLSIYEALLQEEKRLKPVIRSQDYINGIFRYYSYKSRGLYKEQIERYLQYFSWEQILIIQSEELFSESDKTLRRVFDFVGVETEFKVKDLKPRNVAQNRSGVDPRVYEYLDNYFLPHNQALYELVGKNYGW